MNEHIASPLRAWESFYVIVGSAAGVYFALLRLDQETIARTAVVVR